MGIITRMLRQTAVYWAPAKPDQFGKPTFAAPVEVLCRWEDVTEEFIAADGETQMSRAMVYVSIDLLVGGVLLQGANSVSVNQTVPKANKGAWEIRVFKKLPNIRCSEFLRTAVL